MLSATLLAGLLTVAGGSDATLWHFTADWCPGCQGMKPTVERLAKSGVPIREVNIDREPQLVQQFRVTSVPCFVLVAGGREVERIAEPTSFGRLTAMFDRFRIPGSLPEQATLAASPPAPSTNMAAVRGQSTEADSGFALPRPLAALAKGFGGWNQSAEPERPLASAAPAPVSIEAPTSATQIPPAPAQPTQQQLASAQPAQAMAPAPAAAAAWNQLREQALRATVRLRVDDLNGHGFGTGTIVDRQHDEALVVTCGHLFRDSVGKGRIVVDVFDPRNPQPGAERAVEGMLIRYDLERDLAFVAISAPPGVAAMKVAPPGYQFAKGQPVFSIGCDRGAPPTVRDSKITGIDRYVGAPNIEVAGQPVQGRSGGGLFSADGYLIGVCNAADPQDNEGVFASLPAIQWELDRIGQRRVYAGTNPAVAQATSAAPLSSAAPPVSATFPAQPAGAVQDLAAAPLHPIAAHESNPPATALATTDDTEVICIVRSRTNPQQGEQLVVIDRPSRDLLQRLSTESRGAALARQAALPASSAGTRTSPAVRAGLPGLSAPRAPIVRAQD